VGLIGDNHQPVSEALGVAPVVIDQVTVVALLDAFVEDYVVKTRIFTGG